MNLNISKILPVFIPLKSIILYTSIHMRIYIFKEYNIIILLLLFIEIYLTHIYIIKLRYFYKKRKKECTLHSGCILPLFDTKVFVSPPDSSYNIIYVTFSLFLYLNVKVLKLISPRLWPSWCSSCSKASSPLELQSTS